MRKLLAGLTRLLEWAVIGLVALLVFDVLWGVFSRFLLAQPSRWTEEVAIYLLIWVAMLGAAVGFRRQEHLGVDYFVNQLHVDIRRWLAVFVQLLVVGFAASGMVGGGYVLVSETLRSDQLTPALQIPMGYVYLAVPISGVFIVLFSLERIVQLLANEPSAAGPAATSRFERGSQSHSLDGRE